LLSLVFRCQYCRALPHLVGLFGYFELGDVQVHQEVAICVISSAGFIVDLQLGFALHGKRSLVGSAGHCDGPASQPIRVLSKFLSRSIRIAFSGM
jgi:hypothetical protein